MKNERVKLMARGVEEEPGVGNGEIPVAFFGILAGLLFLSFLYLDRYAGGFENQVYRPYASLAKVIADQPNDPITEKRLKGKAIYDTNCKVCHQENGMGTPGQFPPLDGSEWVAGSLDRLIRIPQLGLTGPITIKGEQWNNTMLAMGAPLSDEELASVLTYVRSAWSNKAGPVKADEVKKVRADLAGRTDPLQGGEELQKIP